MGKKQAQQRYDKERADCNAAVIAELQSMVKKLQFEVSVLTQTNTNLTLRAKSDKEYNERLLDQTNARLTRARDVVMALAEAAI
jgi:hypothetical protein